MSTKFMKVYICDYCGKIEPQRIFCEYGDIIKLRPSKWKHICKMDLCSTCASNFARVMEGEKENNNAED